MKKLSIEDILSAAKSCGIEIKFNGSNQTEHKIRRQNGTIESIDNKELNEYFKAFQIEAVSVQTPQFTFKSQLTTKNVKKDNSFSFDFFSYGGQTDLRKNQYADVVRQEQVACELMNNLPLAS